MNVLFIKNFVSSIYFPVLKNFRVFLLIKIFLSILSKQYIVKINYSKFSAYTNIQNNKLQNTLTDLPTLICYKVKEISQNSGGSALLPAPP